jgi:hypothetical protein
VADFDHPPVGTDALVRVVHTDILSESAYLLHHIAPGAIFAPLGEIRDVAGESPPLSQNSVRELGPFLTDGALTRQTLDGLAAVIGKGFVTSPFDTFSFSSGIGDIPPFLAVLKGEVSVRSAISIDPSPILMGPTDCRSCISSAARLADRSMVLNT